MYALVENGSITEYFSGNKGVTIGEYQYPKDIFTKWTNEERVAIGVYPVRVDATNKKDPDYYINTDITYAVSGNEVVGSYGTATAKPLDDILFTQADADANDIPSDKSVGDVKSPGLKNVKIAKVKKHLICQVGNQSFQNIEKLTKGAPSMRSTDNFWRDFGSIMIWLGQKKTAKITGKCVNMKLALLLK